jgi:large subunit ribosomal protein L6
MSRIGKKPISVPAGVTVTIADGNVVTIKGAKGELIKQFSNKVNIAQQGEEIIVSLPEGKEGVKEYESLFGLTRTLVNNMVIGVTNGFTKELEIEGVGYRAAKQGNNLVLNIGYSHQVIMEPKYGVTIDVPSQTKIVISGVDKQSVGQFAAEVREKRLPEPYKGKGIRYAGERIIRKEGKAGKGKK